MPKLKLDDFPLTNRTIYPEVYASVVAGRWHRRLGPASGLTDFGASHVTLEPGAHSSQRHWHEGEDELVIMLAGEAVLIDDNGESLMAPGDIAAFPKGDGNGHMLVNRSDAPCTFVAIGKASATDCHYSDIDLHYDAATRRFTRKDGTPY